MRIRLALAGFLCCAFAAADQTVNVGPGIAFSPSTVTVSPGEKVTWVWFGAFHSSTSDLTTGPEVWDSTIIATGSFDHVFTTPGTYHYYCMVHSFPGGTIMNGVVQVAGAVTATPTPTATPQPSATPTSVPGTPLPTPTPLPPAAIPALGRAGELALMIGLAALALFLLSRRT